MSELALHFEGLQLVVTLVSHQIEEKGKPYLDWLHCRVIITVPSFTGQVDWSVMPKELINLSDDLQSLYDHFPAQGSLHFKPVEPNVELSFEIATLGHVVGEYCLRNDFLECPVLKGPFCIDQSYIPGLVGGLRAFVKEAINAP